MKASVLFNIILKRTRELVSKLMGAKFTGLNLTLQAQ